MSKLKRVATAVESENMFLELLRNGEIIYENDKLLRCYERTAAGKLKKVEPYEFGYTNVTGYWCLQIQYKNVKYNCFAHRVVWRYFNGDIREGWEVDHLDCDRRNYAISNLEAVPPIVNARRKILNGRNNTQKLSDADIVVIRDRIADGESMDKIAVDYGVGRTTISAINTGQIWGWLK